MWLTKQNFPYEEFQAVADEIIVRNLSAPHSRRESMAQSARKKPTLYSVPSKTTAKQKKDKDFEADVLFQRIYDKWYAFSVVDDDCLIAEVPEDQVRKRQRKPQEAA